MFWYLIFTSFCNCISHWVLCLQVCYWIVAPLTISKLHLIFLDLVTALINKCCCPNEPIKVHFANDLSVIPYYSVQLPFVLADGLLYIVEFVLFQHRIMLKYLQYYSYINSTPVLNGKKAL